MMTEYLKLIREKGEFDNYQAQGFNGIIYCPLCYFKELYKREKQEKEDYKSRCEKAIEYIKHLNPKGVMLDSENWYLSNKDLLNILQNGSDNG